MKENGRHAAVLAGHGTGQTTGPCLWENDSVVPYAGEQEEADAWPGCIPVVTAAVGWLGNAEVKN